MDCVNDLNGVFKKLIFGVKFVYNMALLLLLLFVSMKHLMDKRRTPTTKRRKKKQRIITLSFQYQIS